MLVTFPVGPARDSRDQLHLDHRTFMSYKCPVKGKELIKRLKRNGVEIIEGRGKGGHVWAIHNGRKTTVPCHGSADVDPNFLKMICKQLGLDPDDVL